MKRNLALIGPQGAGKTTIASLLCEHFGYARVAIADPIKAIANDAYPGLGKEDEYDVRTYSGTRRTTGRELLQDIGAKLREVDLDIWLRQFRRRYLEAIKAGRLVVIDDVRLEHEVRYLQHIDPLLSVVRIHADGATRAERLGRLTGAGDVTETGWGIAPYDLNVDTSTGTPEDAVATIARWLEGER